MSNHIEVMLAQAAAEGLLVGEAGRGGVGLGLRLGVWGKAGNEGKKKEKEKNAMLASITGAKGKTKKGGGSREGSRRGSRQSSVDGGADKDGLGELEGEEEGEDDEDGLDEGIIIGASWNVRAEVDKVRSRWRCGCGCVIRR